MEFYGTIIKTDSYGGHRLFQQRKCQPKDQHRSAGQRYLGRRQDELRRWLVKSVNALDTGIKAAYNAEGNEVWSQVLDMDGNVIEETGNKGMVPFLFQGQYYDRETGLAYNRFRYYDPKTGNYISQDPIGLAGGNPTLYGYVFDPNTQIDPFGLDCGKIPPKYKTIQDEITQKAKRTAAVVDRWLASSNSKWANAYRNFATTNPNFAALIKGRVIDRRMNAWMRKKYDCLGVFDETKPNSGRMRPDAYFPDLDGKSVIFDIGSKSRIADI